MVKQHQGHCNHTCCEAILHLSMTPAMDAMVMSQHQSLCAKERFRPESCCHKCTCARLVGDRSSSCMVATRSAPISVRADCILHSPPPKLLISVHRIEGETGKTTPLSCPSSKEGQDMNDRYKCKVKAALLLYFPPAPKFCWSDLLYSQP